jgi:hypothetical protein
MILDSGSKLMASGLFSLLVHNSWLSQQAFLLQQRLTDVNHPDQTLITYLNLGHTFYPSSEWLKSIGPMQPYVLADLYTWLEAHSGLSHSYANTTAASDIGFKKHFSI